MRPWWKNRSPWDNRYLYSRLVNCISIAALIIVIFVFGVSSSVAGGISISDGNLSEEVVDYQILGSTNNLAFKRIYNSLYKPSAIAVTFGIAWRSSFDKYLTIPASGVGDPAASVTAERSNGTVVSFTANGGGWIPNTDMDFALLQASGTGVGSIWTLTDRDDIVETYTQISSNQAVLNSITARNGYKQTLNRDGNNRLTSVVDSYNRSLVFTYQNGLVHTVTTPDGLVLTYVYSAIDAGSLLSSVTYSTNPTTSQTYLYESGQLSYALTGIIDENGNRFATSTYDVSGRALTTQHAGGADSMSVVYNDTDGSRTVTYALGEQEINKFAVLQGWPKLVEINRLANSTMPAATRLFTYDSNGYLASESNWNGVLTTYVNDARGQHLTITEAAGTPQQRVTKITYLPNFHLPSRIVTPRTTTNFTYDANGELLSKTVTDNTVRSVPYSTQGQSRTWSYTWANGLMTSSKGPRGSTAELTQYGYDSTGALTSITNALGQVTQIVQHTPSGLPQTIVDPNGVTTQVTYDARQRFLTSAVQAGAPLVTSFAYDAAGNLTRKSLPDGSALTFSHDAAHRLIGITDLDNRRIVYTLDALGNRTQTQIFGGAGQLRRSSTATFDALGRKLSDTGGAGQTTTYAYDNVGNVTSIADPLGRVTQQVFDALNRKIQVTEPNGGVTKIGYNQLDEVNAVTDPMGHITTYVEDGFGDVIEEISPDRGTTVYTYNVGGLLTQKVDAAGVVTNQTWDFIDRLATVTYPGNQAENVTFTYDQGPNGIGRLTGITDAAGTLTLNYNLRGLVSREARGSGGATTSTAYTYDLANRLASITHPSGLAVAYSRDDMGRITAINATPPGSSNAVPVVSAIATLPFGPHNSLTYGDGSVETRSYDLDYRMTNLTAAWGGLLQNLTYTYDANDNVLSIIDQVTPGNSQTFTYNKVNRLNQATGSYGTLGYTYDLVGNRLTQTTTVGQASSIQTYGYDSASNRLLLTASPGNTPLHQFAYSPAGNVVQDIRSGAPSTLTYNQANRLASFSTGGSTLGAYTYDAFGQRLTKAAGGNRTLYQYDPAGHLIQESDTTAGPAAVRANYIYLDDQPVGLYQSVGGMQFLHDDRLGTPQFVTDAHQGIDWLGVYQPFGPVTINASMTQNLRLPGQYFDAETGWSHNGFRTYAQGLGRYIQSDPIGLAGGINPYAYANGNPILNTDRSGTSNNNNCSSPSADNPLLDVGRGIATQISEEAGIISHEVAAIGELASVVFEGYRFGKDPSDPAGTFFKVAGGTLFGWGFKLEAYPELGLPISTFGALVFSLGNNKLFSGWINHRLRQWAAGAAIGCASSGDPTFIQPANRSSVRQVRNVRQGYESSKLTSEISLPWSGALVRANVPIFGLAHGVGFKEYRLEYGQGIDPQNWMPIITAPEPITEDEGQIQLEEAGDLTIHGNLGTWDTGLKNYFYLPDYPKGHPVDLKGTYTVRLVVTGEDGSTAEDRVTLDVGDVIPNALGGSASSADGHVVLTVPEQALKEPFRLIGIQAAEASRWEIPAGRNLRGSVYAMREPGEGFTKDASLRMEWPSDALAGARPEQLGIYAYDPNAARWIYQPSIRLAGDDAVYTRIRQLSPYYALMTSDRQDEGSRLDAPQPAGVPAPADGFFLVRDNFEDGLDEWSNRDRDVGATVSLDHSGPTGTGSVLKITNDHPGGNYAVNVRTTPFDAAKYPIVQFKYRIAADVKTNFLVKVAGRWYEIGFTDDPKVLRDKRVNIAHIGDIAGVVANDQWQFAEFNLYEMLRTKTGNSVVEQMIMADWDVPGFIKLGFGHNKQGATYYIDDFSISRESGGGTRFNDSQIVVDHFDRQLARNAFGGVSDTFSNGGGFIRASNAQDAAEMERGGVLALAYDVTPSGGYAGYTSDLRNLDLRAYAAVHLMVKGLRPGEDILLGLRDRSGRELKMPLSRYLAPVDHDGWQQAAVPLVAFSDRVDQSAVDRLTLTFEHASSSAGVVYVDDILFDKTLGSVLVDNFAPENALNFFGGKDRAVAPGSASINAERAEGANKGVLRLTYGGNIGEIIRAQTGDLFSYAEWGTSLRGLDCSGCDSLSFRIRGNDGGEKPHIYLDDGNFRWGVPIEDYVRVTQNWQDVTIPMQIFAAYGVDLTHLDELQIVFEWEKISGTVYVTDIRLNSMTGPESGHPALVSSASPLLEKPVFPRANQ